MNVERVGVYKVILINLSFASTVSKAITRQTGAPTTTIHQTCKKTSVGPSKNTNEKENKRTAIAKLFALHANAKIKKDDGLDTHMLTTWMFHNSLET